MDLIPGSSNIDLSNNLKTSPYLTPKHPLGKTLKQTTMLKRNMPVKSVLRLSSSHHLRDNHHVTFSRSIASFKSNQSSDSNILPKRSISKQSNAVRDLHTVSKKEVRFTVSYDEGSSWDSISLLGSVSNIYEIARCVNNICYLYSFTLFIYNN